MKTLAFLLFMFSATYSNAQSYSYKPLALDTSCYWVFEYLFYDGGYVCQGERLAAVTGDTLINGFHFSRISVYTTQYPDPPVFMCNTGYLSMPGSTLIREDTIARKLFYLDGSVALDFNLQPGDTLFNISHHVSTVDSVNIQNFFGIDRKVQWGSAVTSSSGFAYKSIEGVGMNYNFPFCGFGEWAIPVYRLKCFSKGGQTLYSSSGTSNCIRKPPAPTAVAKTPDLNRQAFSMDGNKIRIVETGLLPLNMQVFDMAGKLLQTTAIMSSAAVRLDLVPGNYILRLSSERKVGSFMINLL